MKKNSHEPSPAPQLAPMIADGWSLPSEPARGRQGPVLVRSTFMTQVDDGWVLPSEPPTLRLVEEPTAPSAPATQPAEAADSRINLNTASHLDLQKIPGVGQGKASRIVSWRQRHGGFTAVTDLAKVSGFGAKSVAKIADQLSV